MTAPLDEARLRELADLFERLDAILIEESPMHPFGCSSWEESTRIAIDMAKDALSAERERADRAVEVIGEYREVVSRWLAQSCEDDDIPELQAMTRDLLTRVATQSTSRTGEG